MELNVSPSLLSQVETGKSRPSVVTLQAVADFFGLSIDDLLGATTVGSAEGADGDPVRIEPSIQRQEENPVIDIETGVRWERLAGGDDGVEVLLITYAPGASNSVEGKLTQHLGTEYAYLLNGELTLQLDSGSRVLRAGDSLRLEATTPHVFKNCGTVPVRGVWFIVGRRAVASPRGDSARGAGAGFVYPRSIFEVLQRIDLSES